MAEPTVLLITTQWPTPGDESRAPFIVRRVEHLRRAGAHVDVFHFRGGWPRLDRYLRAWLRLRRTLKAHPYDVLDVQFGQSGVITLMQNTPPIVATFHGTELHGGAQPRSPFARVLRLLSRVTMHRADRIILVSDTLRPYVPESLSVDAIIPCGVDLATFTPQPQAAARRALGLDLSARYVLFTGGSQKAVKRPDLARRAVELANTQTPVELLIIDDVSPDRMPLYLNAADVLLLTSSNEGSPTVVKEALACNLPVVSVDVGDVRQRIGGLSGCVLCEDDDPQTIADAISHVLTNPQPFEGRHMVSPLAEEQLTQRMLKIYAAMLAG